MNVAASAWRPARQPLPRPCHASLRLARLAVAPGPAQGDGNRATGVAPL